MKITSFSVYDQKKKVNDLKNEIHPSFIHNEFPLGVPSEFIVMCKDFPVNYEQADTINYYHIVNGFNHILNILRLVGIFIEQV